MAGDTIESLIQAVALGIVQGATEFLPISSSGHLILTSAAFGWNDQGLGFDVGLHLGTLLVVAAYFWRDWATMLESALNDAASGRLRSGASQPTKLLAFIIAATIPAGVAGLVLDDWIGTQLREPWMVAVSLATLGFAMLVCDRSATLHRSLGDLKGRDALVVGLAQTLALFPGVSRSGVTLIAGLRRGLTRADAARFGFLLGTPTIAGAAIVELPSAMSEAGGMAPLMVGMCTSAVVGLLVVSLLMRFLRTRTLIPFAVYRMSLAGSVFVVIALAMAAR